MMSKFILFLLLIGCTPAYAQTYIKGPALIEGITSTATAAGTTTLTVNSQTNQQFTGATTQTVVLPNATTLSLGRYFQIENRSTGIVTVQTNGGGALTSVYPGTQKQVLVTNIGSAAGTWDVSAVSVTDVVGVLPLINGGTNKAMTASSGAIVYSDADSFELDGTHLNWNASIQQLTLNADGASYTAAPANTIMHTVGNNGATSRIVFDSHNSGVNGSYLLGRHARGTAAAPSAVINGDTLMGFAGVGYGATGYASNGSGYLLIRASETFTDTSNATNMQFFTTPTTSITPVQRMYIGSDGHVSLGASAPTTSAKLDIQGSDGALLIPRLTTVQKNALTATAGMQVYDTTLARFECYTSAWGSCSGGKIIGEIFMFTATCPSGSFAADGASLSRVTYAALFSVIGTTFGAVDGSSFSLPDTRGIFIRGSGSQTFGSITYSGTLAVKQNDTFRSHTHTQNSHSHTDSGHAHSVGVTASGSGGAGVAAAVGNNTTTTYFSSLTSYANITGATATNQNTGGAETIPGNISLNYCIQYQ